MNAAISSLFILLTLRSLMSLNNFPVFSLYAAFAIIPMAFVCNSIILFSLDEKLLAQTILLY